MNRQLLGDTLSALKSLHCHVDSEQITNWTGSYSYRPTKKGIEITKGNRSVMATGRNPKQLTKSVLTAMAKAHVTRSK